MLDAIEADILNLETTLDGSARGRGLRCLCLRRPGRRRGPHFLRCRSGRRRRRICCLRGRRPRRRDDAAGAPRDAPRPSPFEAAIAARRARSEAQTRATVGTRRPGRGYRRASASTAARGGAKQAQEGQSTGLGPRAALGRVRQRPQITSAERAELRQDEAPRPHLQI